ncbi:hypothetical protein DVH24_035906 [Malus domestica]|uniref:Uncharacterized protein n=1 Tax=Malus domestica TaxID=3750 RepID=A0A498JNB1_MALDO|nr:hypothetical protein DVH24_035906 [Malus domestica]
MVLKANFVENSWVWHKRLRFLKLHSLQSLQKLQLHEAFWELTGFWFCRNSEVKREKGQSIPRMGDLLESSTHVSFQKQNREDVELRSSMSSHESNPKMGDPLGSSRVSFQKQNREGVVGA